MATVTMDIPEEIANLMACDNKSDELRRNALLLYPFIKNETISHGRAAEILGISKWELTELYGSEGIPYIDQSWDEAEQDAANVTTTTKSIDSYRSTDLEEPNALTAKVMAESEAGKKLSPVYKNTCDFIAALNA